MNPAAAKPAAFFPSARNYFRRCELISASTRNKCIIPATLRPWRTRFTVKEIALALLLALCLAPAASMAQVVIRVGPPAPVAERPGPPPERGFVWIAGYHRWDGAQYVWVPGHYERVPHPGARWVAHKWVHHHDGWVLVEGHWR
jgi:hypothetical protein